ncbi:MAG: polymer-forming cytoskeletal protein [Parvibaculaceae bacterium]
MLFRRFRKNKGRKGRDAGPSIIASDVIIDGNVVSDGDLQVDGTVNGDVRGLSVVVDFNGVIHGEVLAEEVVIRGRVIGHTRGIHVHVYSGGHIEGDILSETISIDHGAYVDGKIHRVDDPLGQFQDEAAEEEDVFPTPQTQTRRLSPFADEETLRPLDFTRRPKAAE